MRLAPIYKEEVQFTLQTGEMRSRSDTTFVWQSGSVCTAKAEMIASCRIKGLGLVGNAN